MTILLLTYGTPLPCAALKKEMRVTMAKSAADNVLAMAFLGNIMPAMDAKIDELGQVQCLRGLYNVAAKQDDTSTVPQAAVDALVSKPVEDKEAKEIKKLYSEWQLAEDVSPVDDSKTVTLSHFSNEEVGEGFSKHRPALVLRCKEKKIDVFVSAQEMIKDSGSFQNEYVPVTIRYDSDAAQEVRMDKSSSYEAFFFPQAAKALKTIEQKKKLVLRYDTYSGSERTVIFNLEGLAPGLEKFRASCPSN